jgi:hypothetical protein
MKRLLSITLALSLIGSSAAMAQPYRGGSYGHDNRHYSAPYRGGHGYDYGRGYGYRDNGGAVAAVGIGILALGLFGALASQNNQYSNGYYAPPPPPYGGYGYAPSYGNSYAPTYGYGGGYYGR